jgi:hypothetical protein
MNRYAASIWVNTFGCRKNVNVARQDQRADGRWSRVPSGQRSENDLVMARRTNRREGPQELRRPPSDAMHSRRGVVAGVVFGMQINTGRADIGVAQVVANHLDIGFLAQV